MSRSGTRRFLTATLVGALALSFAALGDANAGKRKKRRKAAPAAATLKVTTGAQAKELATLMGPYKFDMTAKEILAIRGKQITEKYEELIKATTDVYTQDKLRRKRTADIDRIKKSYTEFKGAKTGWAVSIIDDQFAQNIGVAVMVDWENQNGADQRRFFFFKDGHLYKMFIALNSASLKSEQKNFAFLKGLMETRFGSGRVFNSKDIDGVERPIGLEWRTANHHVVALDKLNFYGSFCLVIANPTIEKELTAMAAANVKAAKPAVMQSVINDGKGDDTPGLDENKAAVDAVLAQ